MVVFYLFIFIHILKTYKFLILILLRVIINLIMIIFLKGILKFLQVNCTISIFINSCKQIMIQEFVDLYIKLIKTFLQLIYIECSDFILIKMFKLIFNVKFLAVKFLCNFLQYIISFLFCFLQHVIYIIYNLINFKKFAFLFTISKSHCSL